MSPLLQIGNAPDTNGDASISRREFIGPGVHFSRLDADGSGRIELHEAASE